MSRIDQLHVNGRAWLGVVHGGSVLARVILSLLLAVMLLSGTLLQGCGYKGPLYLPDKTKQPATDDQVKKKSKQQN
jgi:predicted small lipoprotein YifL